jgi:enamine deaminase RidA (YjgF/YER057c/UK114 family)
MPTFRSIVPSSLELLYSKRGHSPGVCVNGFLFVSGMLGRDSDLNVIPDPEAQLRQCLKISAWFSGRRDVDGEMSLS